MKNKNQLLIIKAVALLKKVDKRTIKYKNSFNHYVNHIEAFIKDYEEKRKNKNTKST